MFPFLAGFGELAQFQFNDCSYLMVVTEDVSTMTDVNILEGKKKKKKQNGAEVGGGVWSSAENNLTNKTQ